MPHCKPSHGTQYNTHYILILHSIRRLVDTRRSVNTSQVNTCIVLGSDFKKCADSLCSYECMHRNEVVCVRIFRSCTLSHHQSPSSVQFCRMKSTQWQLMFSIRMNTQNALYTQYQCAIWTARVACILCSLYYAISQFGIVFVYTITH